MFTKHNSTADGAADESRIYDVYDKFPRSFPLPMLLDGATGTALMRCGMPHGSCTEKWVCEHTDALKAIQHSYAEAGSDALLAPTFGANAPSLARHNFTPEDGIPALNVRLASFTQNQGTLVGGDVSPTGLFIEPYGDATFDGVADIYAEAARGLADADVDFIMCETNISLLETKAAVTGIKSVTDIPVFVTMTVDENGRTLSGDSLLCCLLTLAETGVAAFGANCSVGPSQMYASLAPLVPYAAALGVPLIAKPNAGMPAEDADGRQTFALGPEEFAAETEKLLDAGIMIVGGCCGTDERHIRLLRAACDKNRNAVPDTSTVSGTGASAVSRESAARLACTNNTAVEIPSEGVAPTSLSSIDDISEAAEAAADSDTKYLCLKLDGMDDARRLAEEAYAVRVPLVLSGDAEAVKFVKRRYAGKIAVL